MAAWFARNGTEVLRLPGDCGVPAMHVDASLSLDGSAGLHFYITFAEHAGVGNHSRW